MPNDIPKVDFETSPNDGETWGFAFDDSRSRESEPHFHVLLQRWNTGTDIMRHRDGHPFRFRRRVDAERYLTAFVRLDTCSLDPGRTFAFASSIVPEGEKSRGLAHVTKCDLPEMSRIAILPGRKA